MSSVPSYLSYRRRRRMSTLCPSRRVRPVVAVVFCPYVRAVARLVVVRPLSVFSVVRPSSSVLSMLRCIRRMELKEILLAQGCVAYVHWEVKL